MNEAVIDRTRPVAPGRQRSRAARWWKSSVTGYALLTVLVLAGYATRQWSPLSPESGMGYWLGIIGASMMLALLLYPLRKRFRLSLIHISEPTRPPLLSRMPSSA